MKGRLLIGGLLVLFLMAAAATIYVGVTWWQSQSGPHWNASFEETCVSIQGNEKCTFAEPEKFEGNTFHLELPGGVKPPSSTQQPGVAATPAKNPANPILWTVVNQGNCMCRNRNEAGDPTSDLACGNGTQIPGGTSMLVFCADPKSLFYFERIVR